MMPLTKFAPPHALSWHSEFTKEQFEFKNALLQEGKRYCFVKLKKKGKKTAKRRRRLQVATDLSEVVRSIGAADVMCLNKNSSQKDNYVTQV